MFQLNLPEKVWGLHYNKALVTTSAIPCNVLPVLTLISTQRGPVKLVGSGVLGQGKQTKKIYIRRG